MRQHLWLKLVGLFWCLAFAPGCGADIEEPQDTNLTANDGTKDDSLARSATYAVDDIRTYLTRHHDDDGNGYPELARLRMRLEDISVVGPVEAARLFYNNPDAKQDTPLDDDSYIASIAFFPTPQGDNDDKQTVGTHVVDMRRVFAQLAVEPSFIEGSSTITIVPIGPPERDLSIAVESIQVIDDSGE